jgi:hypothetical protein
MCHLQIIYKKIYGTILTILSTVAAMYQRLKATEVEEAHVR